MILAVEMINSVSSFIITNVSICDQDNHMNLAGGNH